MTHVEAMIENNRVYVMSDVELPRQCRVLITILPNDTPDPIFDIDAIAVETGIPDLANNLDYYLYGKEKV